MSRLKTVGTYAFGDYEVDKEPLRLLTAEEVEQMKSDDEKSLALCLKGRDHMIIR